MIEMKSTNKEGVQHTSTIELGCTMTILSVIHMPIEKHEILCHFPLRVGVLSHKSASALHIL